jgi:flagellar assembly protein FliH
MTQPAKFLFDNDFATGASRSDALTPAAVAARVAEAEQQGYRSGFANGQAEATAETQRRLAVALDRISGAIGTIAAGLAQIEARMETEAVEVAIATARQLCAQLLQREPMAEISALMMDCFRHLVVTPHIAIRINDALYEQGRAHIEDLGRRHGFEGRLVILADPDIELGDCRIEWADGGVTRERAATDAKITELVNRYMTARENAAGATL